MLMSKKWSLRAGCRRRSLFGYTYIGPCLHYRLLSGMDLESYERLVAIQPICSTVFTRATAVTRGTIFSFQYSGSNQRFANPIVAFQPR
eukprot:5680129-Pleurochrysis_carterae.AAC.3